ncbi:(deoxy)nucleoside triphosphate pyrophosphohydrolase [Luteibaculum oceani]|uniref:8-oxo-dGTP diphosphatase n=1 Tax=Luteibaculum oceani TaxID=1294296 RepID=A0A5C6UVE3_9FLAO|nr:(deoxy)nucleoside triphosphate pyrophosphohydrolase [Luteibaculum oceani]TXC76929.1 (deoxy)nucleoside triphosphate pyrophosphohydrolase [Luteibaculum oceani]
MIRVTCALIEANNKVLVVQRSENMSLPNKWEFPGGKIEPNESERACIIREIKEELNIDITVLKRLSPCVYKYPKRSIQLIPFLAVHKGGELKLAEHKKFLWLQKKDLLKLNWAEADVPIVKEYLKI